MAVRKRGVNEGDDPEMTAADTGESVPSYQKGTKRVPKTGLAKLHKDEAVIPAAKNPFSKEQVAEDTDRKMRGLPQVHGAAMEDEGEDDSASAMAGVAPAVEGEQEGEGAEYEDMSHEELCQTVTDQAQTIASLQDEIGEIKAKLGMSDEEEGPEMAGAGEDAEIGFGG